MATVVKKKKRAVKSTALVPATATTSISEIEGKLPKLLQPLFHAMCKSAQHIDGIETRAGHEAIKGWYEIGEVANKVQRDEAKYGDGAMTTLAQALTVARRKRTTSDQLFTASKVVNVYPWAYLEKFIERAEKAQVSLSWAHVNCLASLKRKTQEATRKKFEAETIAHAYSFEELLSLVKDKRAKMGETQGGVGRKPIVPKSPGAACRQILKYRQEVNNRLSAWDQSLFDWIEEAAPEHCDAELQEDLQRTVAGVEELKQTFEEIEDKLTKAMGRVEKILKRKEELDEATGGKKKKKSKVVEDEDIEREIDDEGIEVEEEAPRKPKTKLHETNGHSKPLSVAEKIARAKAKVGAH